MAAGIESVKKVVQDKGIEGVYGPLIENFTCNEKFFTAVEVTAGGKYVKYLKFLIKYSSFKLMQRKR